MTSRFLLTSVATVALIGFSIPQAHAQAKGFLESRMPWAVSKVAADGPRNAYCAMAKKFGADIILTVARNQKGESSFAIDFQHPKFSISKAADVTIDPGAGQQRSYKLQPVSSQAFVVRLGNDAQFFDALKKTGFLRFEIDQQSYSFNLADVGAGDMKLDSCVAASIQRAESVSPGAAVPAKPVQREALLDESYRQELNTLRQELAALKNQNDQLAQKISIPMARPSALPPAASMSAPLAAVKQKDAAIAETAALRAENERLVQELKQKAASPQVSPELKVKLTKIEEQKAEKEAQLKKLEEENRRLKDEVAKAHEKSARAASLRQHIAVTTPAAKSKAGMPEEQETGSLENTIAPEAGNEMLSGDMTEAQRQEQNMMQSMQAPEENFSVRASEDPYAAIESQDNFTGYTSVEGERAQEMNAPKEEISAPAPVAPEEMAPPAITAQAPPPLEPMLSASRPAAPPPSEAYPSAILETAGLTPSEIKVRRRNNMIAMHPGKTVAATAPMQMELPLKAPASAPVVSVPVVTAAAPEQPPEQPLLKAPPPPIMKSDAPQSPMAPNAPLAEPMPMAPPPVVAAGAGIYRPSVSVQTLLSKAGVINGAQQVELVSGASDAGKASYQWSAGELYGSAIQQPVGSNEEFDKEVQDYLVKTEKRCTGEFAAIPDNTKEIGAKRVDSYEIACISPGVNSSASLVFFSIDGTFTAVAHEAPTNRLETAMDIRDRLVREVVGS